jgi:hypothetical protein
MKFKTNTFTFPAAPVADLALSAGLLALMAMVLTPLTMRAQVDPLTLDNFSTGPGKVDATSGTRTVRMNGSGIYGGSRAFSILLNKGSNEFAQTAQAQVRTQLTDSATPSAMLVSEGYGVNGTIQLEYEGPTSESLNLDMVPYNRFRVTYAGVAELLTLEFLVIDNTAQYSNVFCAVGPYAPSLSSSGFTTVDILTASFPPTHAGPVNWGNIELVELQWTPANSYGVNNFAVTDISALTSSDTSVPTVMCTPAS